MRRRISAYPGLASPRQPSKSAPAAAWHAGCYGFPHARQGDNKNARVHCCLWVVLAFLSADNNNGETRMTLTQRLSLFAAAAAFTASTAAFAAPTFINILTGGTSGVYYPIGVGLSQLYGDGIDGAKTSVQATKASVENLNLLQAGRGELALALGDSVADAWNGVEDAGFKAPLQKLRA